MPLILTENRQFSLIHFKPNTHFKMGKLGTYCGIELIYESSKLEDAEFKSIKSYLGSVCDGVFHGHGKLKYTNGDMYKGMFKFGRKDGKGFYKNLETGDEYDSEWQDDLLHGKCCIKFGISKKKGKVDLGDFEKGWNNLVDGKLQKNVLPSFLTNEFNYTPPVSKMQFNEPELKFDLEAMVKRAF
jgi:hypothetical protein